MAKQMSAFSAVVCLLIAMTHCGAFTTVYLSNRRLESIYPVYKLVEEAVENDPLSMFIIKQTFFPATNYRYWQVDGAEVVCFKVCVMISEAPLINNTNIINANDSSEGCTEHWTFHWTNSLLLNLIPGDLLLAMDPVQSVILYSNIVQHPYRRTASLKVDFNQSLSVADIEQALVLFLSMSKVKVSLNSDPKYQGYVAKWYTYYNSDSYFSTSIITNKKHITQTLLSIWMTFIFLNLLVPILSITRGRKIVQTVREITTSRAYNATVIVIAIFNSAYLMSMLIVHAKGLPTILNCYMSPQACNIPRTLTSYTYILGIFITKAVILSVAIVIELAAAFSIAKSTNTADGRPTKCCVIKFVAKTLVIWHLFVFIQITVGLLSIPFIIFLFVSPIRVVLLGGLILLLCITVAYIIVTVPLPRRCKIRLNGLTSSMCIAAETFVIVALGLSACIAYYLTATYGLNMSGVKGYITSLIPIVMSILIWYVKKRYFTKKFKNRSSQERKIKATKQPEEAERCPLLEKEMLNLPSSSEEN